MQMQQMQMPMQVVLSPQQVVLSPQQQQTTDVGSAMGPAVGEPVYQQQMPDGSLVFVRAQSFFVQQNEQPHQQQQPSMKEQVAQQLRASSQKASVSLRQEVE